MGKLKRLEVYREFRDENKSVMYVAFCCDENYLIPVSIMLESLIRHNKDINIVAYSFKDDLSESAIRKLEKIMEKHGELRMCYLPMEAKEIIDRAPLVGGYISKATYYRLMLPYVVGDEVDKIIYLDGDILIRGSLREVYERELKGALIGGIRDYNADEFESSRGVNAYINAGVLVIDIKNMKKKYPQEQLLKEMSALIKRNNLLADQDIINSIFNNQIKLLPIIYNNHYLVQKKFALKERKIMKDTIVAHFSGSIKPWTKEYFFPYTKEYYLYLKKYIVLNERIKYWLYKPIAVLNSGVCAVKRELKQRK